MMPRGDKSKYTDKQVRQADAIEDGYRKEGMLREKAEAIAWQPSTRSTAEESIQADRGEERNLITHERSTRSAGRPPSKAGRPGVKMGARD